jgi:glutamate racemase
LSSAEQSIGVFDSGLGGLTVLREIHNRLPQENLIYFGDTARVPYGNKSSATIIRYSREIATFLLARDVKAIVVACNTASSYALEALRSMTQVPVIGVIDPAVRRLVQKAGPQSVAGLIATKGTIVSGAYDVSLQSHGGLQKLVGRACPLLVPLIEEGYADSEVAALVLRDYLDSLAEQKVEHLILGCTHYPLIARAIERLYPQFQLIDSAEETATELRTEIGDRGLLRQGSGGRVELYVSDMTDSMRKLRELFFAASVDKFTTAQIGEG